VTLIHRGTKLSEGIKYWVLPDIENRLKAGQIRGLFDSTVEEIRERSIFVKTQAGIRELPQQFTFILTGFLPDVDHLKTWGVELDDMTLAPLHNPTTLETKVKGMFVAGSVAAGRNTNKIFVENGRLHGEAIVKAILAIDGK
jgi:thioredoxin reductase (NADPH)